MRTAGAILAVVAALALTFALVMAIGYWTADPRGGDPVPMAGFAVLAAGVALVAGLLAVLVLRLGSRR